MRKGLMLSLVVFILMAFVVCAPANQAMAKKITLKLVAAWPPDQFNAKPVLERWMKGINERAKGELEIVHVGGPEVMKAEDALKNCGRGLIDIVVSSFHYYGRDLPQSTILFMCYFPLDVDFVKLYYESGIFDRLSELNEQKTKTKLLGLHGFSDFVICSTKPILSLDDMKGTKVRAQGGHVGELVKWLGATPVKVASPEIGAAAMTGVIEAAYRPALAIKSWGEGDVWKDILLPGQIALGANWISTKAWNKLPKHLQDLLMDESYKHAQWWNGQLQERTWVKEYEKEFGIKVNWLSKEEQKRWEEVYQKIDPWFLEHGGEGSAELLEMARKQLKKMGY